MLEASFCAWLRFAEPSVRFAHYTVLVLTQTKQKTRINSGLLFGRDKRMLLELFKYITENSEPAQTLLEKLRVSEQREQKFVESLIY